MNQRTPRSTRPDALFPNAALFRSPLNRHVAAFAKDCAFDLGGKRLKLDSLWINVLEPGGTHSGHIHPHSVVSGTIYVAVPTGSGALKQIGRASCRERACPYVSISAVAVTLQNKKRDTLFIN